jgi:hypothetical protein
LNFKGRRTFNRVDGGLDCKSGAEAPHSKSALRALYYVSDINIQHRRRRENAPETPAAIAATDLLYQKCV